MCRAFDYAEMAYQHIYGHRISIFHWAVPRRYSPSYDGAIGQGMGIVERKGLLKNGDEETRKPFIDE
jgi:hypothetical protein